MSQADHPYAYVVRGYSQDSGWHMRAVWTDWDQAKRHADRIGGRVTPLPLNSYTEKASNMKHLPRAHLEELVAVYRSQA